MDSMDFYTTGAQVIPVLIVAVLWESRYLDQLTRENRGGGFWRRRSDKGFWTDPRIRWWTRSVVAT